MIPPPHGGHLVQRVLGAREKERREGELKDLPQIRPVIDELYDAEKIATGAYSPLEGFMESSDLESVLAQTRLASGLPWSMPILCTPSSPEALKTLAPLKAGDDVALLDTEGHFFAVLHLSERYPIDRKRVAQSTFATTDVAHPNVADIFAAGEEAFAGKIDLVRPLDLPARETELTPTQTRAEFERRGWKNVAAYQCRNPPHTAHEYLQRLTLERHEIDGLLVHPVVGRLKKGDYRPDVILRAYTELVRAY
jgi:sulfate adenylyltransferase